MFSLKKPYSSVLLFFSLVFAGVTLSSSAFAFSYWTCNGTPVTWEYNRVHFVISDYSFPHNTICRKEIEDALNSWNNVVGMYDIFSYRGDLKYTTSINHSNRVNQIAFVSPKVMDGAVGVTHSRYDSTCFWWFSKQYIIESDIMFPSNYRYDLGVGSCNEQPFMHRGKSLKRVAMHELGHAMGLEHTSNDYSFMGTSAQRYIKFCGPEAYQPNPDDARAGRFLYGSGKSSLNLAASSFQVKKTLTKGRVTTENHPSDLTEVCPGDHISITTTVSNTGASSAYFDIHWYLSTNDYISTYDLLAKKDYWYLGGYYTKVHDQVIKIPKSVRPGEIYYIGFIADPHNYVDEDNESDNATYSQRHVIIKHFCR